VDVVCNSAATFIDERLTNNICLAVDDNSPLFFSPDSLGLTNFSKQFCLAENILQFGERKILNQQTNKK